MGASLLALAKSIYYSIRKLTNYQQYAKFALVAIVETWPVWRGRWTDLCDTIFGE